MKNHVAKLEVYAADGSLYRSWGACIKLRAKFLESIAREEKSIRPYKRRITRAHDGKVLLELDPNEE